MNNVPIYRRDKNMEMFVLFLGWWGDYSFALFTLFGVLILYYHYFIE
jgi:hypothetical protein